jgi:hypothetical protein
MSIKVKRKKARRIDKIYVRKEENWETFNLFLNHKIEYTPRTRQSIFDIVYDVMCKRSNGLEFKSEDVDGIKELYFKNGEEDS